MSQPALPGVFGAMAPALDHYGYLAVALLVTLEDFGIPVPGETVLVAASLYAGAGRMNVAAVGVIGFLAATVGDNIGYAIGRSGGRALALRFGKYVFLTSERLRRAEEFFGRQGGKIVVVARFIEGLRQANGIVAGITGMPWPRFAVFNAIGAALWVGVWVSAGDLAGSHILAIYDQVTRYSAYALIAAAVVVAGLAAWHLRRHLRRRGRPAGNGPVPGGDSPAARDSATSDSSAPARDSAAPAANPSAPPAHDPSAPPAHDPSAPAGRDPSGPVPGHGRLGGQEPAQPPDGPGTQ